MTQQLSAFVSELKKSASDINLLTKDERAGLMQRAANTIRDLREQTSILGPVPANDNSDDPLDVVTELREMARLVFAFKPEEIAERLTNAAEIIAIGQRLLDERASRQAR
ncbi:hypothetical protein [Tianweitania sp.]|uniref:hypothetical protein n=1 Tax=Tianweitania sp. TaxID=2021634 RepID=UPI00289EBA2E|nr:hypothetical protein [Tianweitania sp.]